MKRMLTLLLAVALVVALAACSLGKSDKGASGGGSDDKPLVGISVPLAQTGWVAAVQYHADQAAKKAGLNYKIVASTNPGEQSAQIDDLISLKPKAIVLFPHNDQVAVAAQRIKDAGIKLIVFDRSINPTKPDHYLAGDNYGMGVAGANYIADKLGGKGDVIIAGIAAYGDAVNGSRIQGFKDTIAKVAPDIKIIGEYDSPNGAPESGLKTMTDALQANKKIDGVFSIDDELSVGLYQAIKEQNRTDIKVMTGGGGAQSYFKLMSIVPDDMWLASALYSPNMIIDCIKIAEALLKGETPAAETIVPSKIVDRQNVAEYLDEGSPY